MSHTLKQVQQNFSTNCAQASAAALLVSDNDVERYSWVCAFFRKKLGTPDGIYAQHNIAEIENFAVEPAFNPRRPPTRPQRLKINPQEIIKTLGGKLTQQQPPYILAGGAIANVICALLWGENPAEAVVNDIDVYRLEKPETQTLPGRTHSQTGTRLEYHKLGFKITGKDGYLQKMEILCPADTIITQEAEASILKQSLFKFDLNCTQAGLVQHRDGTWEVVATKAFREFIQTRRLQLTNLATPFNSLVRLHQKAKDLGVELSDTDLKDAEYLVHTAIKYMDKDKWVGLTQNRREQLLREKPKFFTFEERAGDLVPNDQAPHLPDNGFRIEQPIGYCDVYYTDCIACRRAPFGLGTPASPVAASAYAIEESLTRLGAQLTYESAWTLGRRTLLTDEILEQHLDRIITSGKDGVPQLGIIAQHVLPYVGPKAATKHYARIQQFAEQCFAKRVVDNIDVQALKQKLIEISRMVIKAKAQKAHRDR